MEALLQSRSGDSQLICFRPDRFAYICGSWYVSTREQGSLGPFETRKEAEMELMLHLRTVTCNNKFRPDAAEFSAILSEC
jgi:hypothetical protein